MKKYLVFLCAIAFICASAVSADADVLTFDDITTEVGEGRVPDGYGGFTWSEGGFFYFHRDYQEALNPGAGWYEGVVSGNYAVSNAYGWFFGIVVSDDGPFDFIGAYLSTPWVSTHDLRVTGWLGDTELYQQDIQVIRSSGPTWFEFNFTGIDKLEIASWEMRHFIMDDFTFNPYDPCADLGGDVDEDGVCADEDNCPNDPNPDQEDADEDGVGDVCDICPSDPDNDTDSDGICADEDNCPNDPNPDQINTDDDEQGDACDPDDDNDGVHDGADNCSLVFNPGQEDFDGDGAGDACDTDNDGDGIEDAVDQCPYTAPGEVINETGCSIADLCPCDNTWKNHGSYVRCVAHASEAFVADGLITEVEKDAVVSEAAQSLCGHKK
jgi:hypothetical protein